jgi:O-antigen ligase
MSTINRKILFWQWPIVILLSLAVGLGMVMLIQMSWIALLLFVSSLIFLFSMMLISDLKRFFLGFLVMTIPLGVDINFIHVFENQAGAATIGIALRDIFVLLLLAWWILDSHRRKGRVFRFTARLTLPAILYFEACLITLLWAPRLDLASFELVQMGKVLILYFVVMNQLEDKSDVNLVVWSLVAAVAFQSSLAMLQMAAGRPLGLEFLGEMQVDLESGDQLSRVGGTLGHPNRLAMFLELLLPLCFAAFLVDKRPKWRMAAIIIFTVGMAAMIMTGSRGGWIAALGGMALLFYFLIKRDHMKLTSVLKLAFLLFFILVIVFSIFSGQIIERITGEDHGSALSRIPMFQIAIEIIKDHPFGGLGINNYQEIMREYNNTYLGRLFSTIPRPVHNMYLLITGETGFLGFAMFLWMLVALMRMLIQTTRAADSFYSIISIALLGGLIGYLVHGLVDKHPPGGSPLFYLLMALAAGTFSLSGKNESTFDRGEK